MQKNAHSYSKPLFPAGEAGILDQPHLSAAMMLKSMESRMSSHQSWAGHCPTKLPMASKADDQPLPEPHTVFMSYHRKHKERNHIWYSKVWLRPLWRFWQLPLSHITYIYVCVYIHTYKYAYIYIHTLYMWNFLCSVELCYRLFVHLCTTARCAICTNFCCIPGYSLAVLYTRYYFN